VIVAVLIGLPAFQYEATAQTGAAGLAGVVTDASGGVMPGVTVEAASPALIEKVRITVTDSEGRYRIVDLRPGRYTVTFTLPGFNTLRREGIELPANFTATIHGQLVVGAFEETITVSGQTPVVDVQNTTTRNVIPAETLQTLPTAQSFMAYSTLTVGVMAMGNNPSAEGAQPQDVGGTKGDTMVFMRYHGSRDNDAKITVDGFETNFLGFTRLFIPNPHGAQETSLDLGGGTAQHSAAGVQLNIIPKNGGNRFSGDYFGTYTDGTFQWTNITRELESRGLAENTINRLDKSWDVSGTLGGPIAQDKLWFFGSHRQWGGGTFVAGLFYNATPNTLTYTADLSRPAVNDFRSRTSNVRLTWQASPRNKIGASYDWQHRCDCHRDITALRSPEAVNYRIYRPVSVFQTTWNFPASNRLLLDAGFMYLPQQLNVNPQPELTDAAISVTEQTGNFTFGAMPGTYANWGTTTTHSRFSGTYVTGAHAFKAGIDMITDRTDNRTYKPNNVQYTFRDGLPVSLTQYAEPFSNRTSVNPSLGVYAQDQWTMKRLTLNLGLRFDYLNLDFPAYSLAPVQYRPDVLDFQAVDCVLCSTNLAPRIGASYDLFGNGKTPIKATLGHYVLGRVSTATTPASSIVRNATRSWTDRNRDFVPDCDLRVLIANGECGQVNNLLFGQSVPGTRQADDVREDYRGYSWQTSVVLQHELMERVGATIGYYRNSWSNFTVTDNEAVTPADYDPFCVTLPSDPRLPGGGGNQLCGLYNVTPTKFGQVDNLINRSSLYGTQTDVYSGVDITIQARLGNGAMVGGGASFGSTTTDRCFVVDSPQELLFCRDEPPYRGQFKFNGVYPLPWDLQVSSVFQSHPGPAVLASHVVSSAEVAQSLGRPLSGNQANVTIPNIIEPNTIFEGRSNQLDVRFTRIFRLGGGVRLMGNFDIYNVLNASPVLATNTRYGPTWLQPTVILEARLLKFSGQLSF
jgi:hypothetical protein